MTEPALPLRAEASRRRQRLGSAKQTYRARRGSQTSRPIEPERDLEILGIGVDT
jgi:hypothetical protein